MKTGLLICDHVLEKFRPISGGYENMFPTLMPALGLVPYFVCDGQFPTSVHECDAFLTQEDDAQHVLQIVPAVAAGIGIRGRHHVHQLAAVLALRRLLAVIHPGANGFLGPHGRIAAGAERDEHPDEDCGRTCFQAACHLLQSTQFSDR